MLCFAHVYGKAHAICIACYDGFSVLRHTLERFKGVPHPEYLGDVPHGMLYMLATNKILSTGEDSTGACELLTGSWVCHLPCRSASAASGASKAASQASTDNDEARRRFGNAKSISSSMYDEDTNKSNDYEKQAMLSKFSVF